MKHKKISDEVYVAQGGVVLVRSGDLQFLKDKACTSPKKRSRLCAHPDSQDRLHEMLIVLDHQTYVRPHRHRGKSESFHLIEGELTVILFHENGAVRDLVHLGPYGSGKPFFYRLMEDTFHTPVITSPQVVFHETTNGPFDRTDTEFAPWAPDETDTLAAEVYLAQLRGLSQERSCVAVNRNL